MREAREAALSEARTASLATARAMVEIGLGESGGIKLTGSNLRGSVLEEHGILGCRKHSGV